MARRGRENPPVDAGIVLLASLAFLLVVLTDPVVWWGVPPDFIFPVPSLGLFLASLLFLPLNGWLAHSFLTRWTPRDRERPRWVRAVRFAAASLFPFGDFAIVPFWRELLHRNPSWIRPRDDRPLRLTLPGPSGGSFSQFPRRPVLERLYRSENFRVSLNIASALPFFLGGLMAADPDGALGRPGAIAVNLGLHTVSFFGMSRAVDQFSYQAAGSRWTKLLPVSCWSLLIPMPVNGAGLLYILLTVFGSFHGTWIGALYSQRFDALRFPLWRQAGRAFRPALRGFSWADLTGRLPAADPPREGRSAGRREALARLTLLFVAPEAGLLTWAILKAGGWQLRESTLIALMIIAVILALGGVLLQAVPGVAEKLGWERVQALSPYLRSGALFLPEAGCLTGVLGGAAAARGDVRLVGAILDLFTLFLAILGVVYALRGFVTKRFDLGQFSAWGLLYSALATLTILLKAAPGDLAERAVILVLVVPFLHLLAGMALLPALLRPFTWKDIRDPRRPFGLRIVLALLSLTAVLPLGGLAAPFWIWARQSFWLRYLAPPRHL